MSNSAISPLSQLNARICECLACPLGRVQGTQADGTVSYHVPGEGPERARVVIVGEAPGAEEERTGRPFIGRSGQLLTEILAAAGLNRGEMFVTSVCKCRPPKNRNPHGPEIAACLPWLFGQLRLLQPELLLSVGNVPTQTLLGVKTGIKTLRGAFHSIQLDGRSVAVRPLFHPAFLLRNPRRTPGTPWDLTLHDLMEARDFLQTH